MALGPGWLGLLGVPYSKSAAQLMVTVQARLRTSRRSH